MKKFWQRLVLFGLTGAFFVSCISCSAANTASKVPILMYHNLTNDPSALTILLGLHQRGHQFIRRCSPRI